ncbi:MAG: winged helix family transcriptional regulator [Sphingobacteriales bacterium]|nr:MAG: winged helix family transcriptional regulator [Sphingobacteriales bacterium]
MFINRNLPVWSLKYLYGLVLLIFIASISLAFTIGGNDDFAMARREVLLRRIGHEILLQSGDSTSRVLPVRKIADNEYEISFENDLTFQPEALVNTAQQLLAGDARGSDYIVNVLKCKESTVAYGFAISKNKKDDIVACKGRIQPAGCYLINIKFKPTVFAANRDEILLGGISLLALLGFVFLRPFKTRKPVTSAEQITEANPVPVVEPSLKVEPLNERLFTLGSVIFDAKARTLAANETSIELTNTEARVLRMFASSPNEVIERSRLQKEIWEDEGVIVGRSLDMFISKLRKKLELDPNLRIVVIRSKGYKLEIGS